MVRAISVANVQISTCVASVLTFRAFISTMRSKQLDRPTGSVDEDGRSYEGIDLSLRVSGMFHLVYQPDPKTLIAHNKLVLNTRK